MKTVLLLTPDITDTSSARRGEALVAQGCRLLMVGFRRGRYNQDYSPSWPFLLLGHTEDGRYGQRLGTLLRALAVLAVNRRQLEQADVIYARNIDQMILALFVRLLVRRHIPTVYEVLDIQPAFVGQGRLSRMLRAVERYALKHISLLVLSSPAFLRPLLCHKHSAVSQSLTVRRGLPSCTTSTGPPPRTDRCTGPRSANMRSMPS